MVRGQTVAQPHCQFQRLLIVYCFESSTHAHQYTITGQPYLLLSDKLLGVGCGRVPARCQHEEQDAGDPKGPPKPNPTPLAPTDVDGLVLKTITGDPPMTTTANIYQNYIGGKWQGAGSGETFPNYTPATGELIGYFPLSGEVEANAAVVAARAAFEKWRLVPAPKRGEILYRVGELLKQHKEELARTMTQEMGKVLKETRGDVQEGIDMAYYMGGEARTLLGRR